jgi:uncharacterized RDD family membrane protein YckC
MDKNSEINRDTNSELTALDLFGNGEMEIEEMQVLWNSQEQERLFAINERALHATIQRKGRNVDRLLQIVEWLMIAVNLGVGIFLLVDGLRDYDMAIEYLMPVLYLGFFLYILYRRVARRREEATFAPTMMGDLDKAIWRLDYLINQGRTIVFWYLVPLMGAAFLVIYLNSGEFLPWAWMLLLIPAAYFGSSWEARKFYLPKKRELEALREKLMESPQ